MSASKNFNDKAGRFADDVTHDDYLLAGMLASAVLERSLSAEGRALYERISDTMVFDRKALTTAYTVPTGANPQALKEALQLIDATSDPAIPVLLQNAATGKTEEMERDPHLFSKLNTSVLRRTLREAQLGSGALPEGAKKLLYPPKPKP